MGRSDQNQPSAYPEWGLQEEKNYLELNSRREAARVWMKGKPTCGEHLQGELQGGEMPLSA